MLNLIAMKGISVHSSLSKNWDKAHLEYWVLFIGLSVGILLVYLTPPLQVADEDSHLKRAFALSDLKFFAEVDENRNPGHYIPRMLIEFEAAHSRMKGNIAEQYSFQELYLWSAAKKINFEDRVFNTYSSSKTHPLFYISQAIGIKVGRLLGNDTPLLLLHNGRLFNLFVFLLAIFWAIRLTPICKVGFGLLSVMPMTISLASSMNPDATIISVCFLLVAYILRLAYNPEPQIFSKHVLGFIFFSTFLIFVKTVYFPLLLLIFLISRSKFVAISYWKSVSAIFAIGPLIFIIWKIAESFKYSDFLPAPQAKYFAAQIDFILSNPLQTLGIFVSSLREYVLFYMYSFVGNLGWLDTNFPTSFIGLYVFLLILAFLFEDTSGVKIRLFHKLFMLAICSLIVGLILLAIYITYTSLPNIGGVGYHLVSGTQGRYFIPIAATVGICLSGTRVSLLGPNKKYIYLVKSFSLASVIFTLLITLLRYYR